MEVELLHNIFDEWIDIRGNTNKWQASVWLRNGNDFQWIMLCFDVFLLLQSTCTTIDNHDQKCPNNCDLKNCFVENNLRVVDREWALGMHHQISLPLTMSHR